MNSPLTEREHEVLRLMAAGRTNKDIATQLSIARGTVDLHVHHILNTLGVANRVAAVRWFLEQRSSESRVGKRNI